MKRYLFLLFGLAPLLVPAQETLTLKKCYVLAEKNYPLGKQSDLLEKKATAEIATLNKGKLPQLDLNAQASYQSDVIHFPGQIPNFVIETPNKDQYRATLDASQLIYNGGNIAAKAKLRTAEMKIQQQEVAVNLYGLKARINQNFFRVLLLQEQIKLLLSKMEKLEARTKEIESGIKHGAVLPSSKQLLQAEILKLEQQLSETDFGRKKALGNLSLLLAQDFDENTNLASPELLITIDTVSKRPELKLFKLQQDQLENSKELIDKANYPKLMGFAQVGYGNPGLNMLDNSFQDFYRIGLRLNWNVFDWGKTKQQKRAADISKELLSTEKETFQLNNGIQVKGAKNEIDKYKKLLTKDIDIIDMRKKVLESTTVQLKNGAITSSEYVTELNNFYEAQINQQLHKIQLLLAKANYKVIKGDSN